jgi:hypothetical protein
VLEPEIGGFGAASVGHGVLSTAVPDAAFSKDNDPRMGLSILGAAIVGGGQSD